MNMLTPCAQWAVSMIARRSRNMREHARSFRQMGRDMLALGMPESEVAECFTRSVACNKAAIFLEDSLIARANQIIGEAELKAAFETA